MLLVIEVNEPSFASEFCTYVVATDTFLFYPPPGLSAERATGLPRVCDLNPASIEDSMV